MCMMYTGSVRLPREASVCTRPSRAMSASTVSKPIR